ncbi:MAG: DMT family transporter [Hyphomicrobiaceae bacterium]|nr:DMT family transporter [Hyphomicrobiaceae bacterium]
MRRQDWIELSILSLLWGTTFFAVAIALKEVPPVTLVLARCSIAAAVLIPVVWLMGHALPKGRTMWGAFLVMAILNNILPFTLIFYGQQFIPSGLTSVINGMTPLMSLLVARAFAGEQLAWNKFAGVLIGILGVAILIGPELTGVDSNSAIGMLAVLAATFCYGLSGLWGRRFKSVPPIASAATQVTCATLLMLPIAAASDQFWTLPALSTKTWAAILSLAILSTALAYIFFYRIMARAGSNNVMLVTLLIPISAISLGVIGLGETLTLQQVIGTLVIGLSLLVNDGRLIGVATPAPQPK